MKPNIYVINKSVVLSIETLINSQIIGYGWKPPTITENDYKQIDTFYQERDGYYSKSNGDCIIYLGELSQYANPKLYLIVRGGLDINARKNSFVYLYTSDDFYNYIDITITDNTTVEINSYGDRKSIIFGFNIICNYFVDEYISYKKNKQMNKFMYLYKPLELVVETQDKEMKKKAEDISYDELNKHNSDYSILATMEDNNVILLSRDYEFNIGNYSHDIECNCSAFFHRKNESPECEHIKRYLYMNEDVPFGEMVPEDVNITVEGKEFLANFRTSNDSEVFKCNYNEMKEK